MELPDIEGADYLVGLLSEAGFVSNTGMGIVPLSWLELDAWIRVTQIELSVWEKLMLREMSETYASGLNAATAKDQPAPYLSETATLQEHRNVVQNKLRQAFGDIKRKKEAAE